MRFFLTDECPDLEAELRRLGHEICGGPADRVKAVCAGSDWHPKRYDVRPHVQGHRPDVCLFVGPLRVVPVGWPGETGARGLSEFGYARDQIVAVKGTRGCLAVGVARPGDDPEMARRYASGMCPKCVGGPQSYSAWATTHEPTAIAMARDRRCAIWHPGEGGADGLVRMCVESIRRSEYRGGRMATPFRPG